MSKNCPNFVIPPILREHPYESNSREAKFAVSQTSGKQNLPGSQNLQEVKISGNAKFPGKSKFLGSQNFQELKISGKSHFLEKSNFLKSLISGKPSSWEAKFLGDQISWKPNLWEAKSPGKSKFPGGQICQKSHFPGTQNLREVKFARK